MIASPNVMNASLALQEKLVDIGRRSADVGVRGSHVAFLVTAHANAAAAGTADVARRQRDIHQGAVGPVIVVAPDQPLLVGEHRAIARAAVLRFADPLGGGSNLVDSEPCDLGGVFERRLVRRHRLVEVLGRRGDEVLVSPALLGKVSEPGVEQREIGSGIDRQMHDVVFACFDFAGVDGHGSAWVDENDPGRRMRFAREFRLLLVDRISAQIRNPVIEEIVGLRFERVGAHRDDRIREFGVLVAIVEFADAHVARRVDLGIVGRTIVDANVLDLHSSEIELSGAPGVLVSAARAAMIERGDEQAIFALIRDHRRRNARDEIERVVPTGRLHLAVAPNHGCCEALLLRRTRLGEGFFGHARAAHGREA